MQMEDARKFVAVLMVTYPNYNPIDEELAAETWASITEEYSYKQVDMALKIYMKSNTSGFPPVPGQIIDKIHTMTTPQELNEMEAWSLVSRAIRNSGYNSVDEFEKLPPLIKKAVGQHEQLRIWALDEEYNESVVSSNFMRSYRLEVTRENELSKMPKPIAAMIKNANAGSYKAQIEAKRKQAYISALERKSPLELPESSNYGRTEMPEDARIEYERLKELCGR